MGRNKKKKPQNQGNKQTGGRVQSPNAEILENLHKAAEDPTFLYADKTGAAPSDDRATPTVSAELIDPDIADLLRKYLGASDDDADYDSNPDGDSDGIDYGNVGSAGDGSYRHDNKNDIISNFDSPDDADDADVKKYESNKSGAKETGSFEPGAAVGRSDAVAIETETAAEHRYADTSGNEPESTGEYADISADISADVSAEPDIYTETYADTVDTAVESDYAGGDAQPANEPPGSPADSKPIHPNARRYKFRPSSRAASSQAADINIDTEIDIDSFSGFDNIDDDDAKKISAILKKYLPSDKQTGASDAAAKEAAADDPGITERTARIPAESTGEFTRITDDSTGEFTRITDDSTGEFTRITDDSTGEFTRITDKPAEKNKRITDKPTEEFTPAGKKTADEPRVGASKKAAASAPDESGGEDISVPPVESDFDSAKDAAVSEGIKKKPSRDDFDETDINLMLAFGLEEELAKTVGSDKIGEIEKNMSREDYGRGESEEELSCFAFKGAEYRSHTQTKEIMSDYKSEFDGMKLRLLGTALLFLSMFFYEFMPSAGVYLPGALDARAFPAVYALLDLQLLLLCAAVSYPQLMGGLKKLSKMRITPHCLAAFYVIITALYNLSAAFIWPSSQTRLYNLPAAFLIVLVTFCDYMILKREIYSFNIIASKKPKFALTSFAAGETANKHPGKIMRGNMTVSDKTRNEPGNLSNGEVADVSETDAPVAGISSDSIDFFEGTLLKIQKVSFIDNYFKRTSRASLGLRTGGFAIPLFIASAVFGILSYYINKDTAAAVSVSIYTLMFCAPVPLILSGSLPGFRASKIAFDDDSAIIGGISDGVNINGGNNGGEIADGFADEYSESRVITFDDRDVFPSSGVKVKSIKIYGNNRIDKVLYYLASVYSATGSPLHEVFELATLEIGKSDNVRIVLSSETGDADDRTIARAASELDRRGIEAVVDGGTQVLAGNAEYMESYDIYAMHDPDDERHLTDRSVVIMYIAINGELAAKLYVQYILDADFELTLRQLYRHGAGAVINTCDPNIDEVMLARKINLNKYPLRINRIKAGERQAFECERADSGIVSRSSSKSLIKTLFLYDKLRRVGRINSILSVISLIVSLVICSMFLIFNSPPDLSSVYVVLYQLFWIVPVFIISGFYIN